MKATFGVSGGRMVEKDGIASQETVATAPEGVGGVESRRISFADPAAQVRRLSKLF